MALVQSRQLSGPDALVSDWLERRALSEREGTNGSAPLAVTNPFKLFERLHSHHTRPSPSAPLINYLADRLSLVKMVSPIFRPDFSPGPIRFDADRGRDELSTNASTSMLTCCPTRFSLSIFSTPPLRLRPASTSSRYDRPPPQKIPDRPGSTTGPGRPDTRHRAKRNRRIQMDKKNTGLRIDG
jgi:hypothetical protein